MAIRSIGAMTSASAISAKTSDRDHDSEPCCKRLTGERRMLFMRALTVRVQRLAHSARANLVE
jgi:hypothetical protein